MGSPSQHNRLPLESRRPARPSYAGWLDGCASVGSVLPGADWTGARRGSAFGGGSRVDLQLGVRDIAVRRPRVKTTLGQPYRRVWLSRKLRDEGIDWREQTPEQLVSRWPGGAATNDGRGIFFISHLGSVYPSGFLPVLAGDVRRDDLVLLYRESPVFQSLRSSDELGGKCGLCPFRKVCGGCRARAFAMTGDYLAADPTCPFQPAGWDSRSESTVTAV